VVLVAEAVVLVAEAVVLVAVAAQAEEILAAEVVMVMEVKFLEDTPMNVQKEP
jgi:hypothetical protein